MAVSDATHENDPDLGFVDNSYLTYIVPCETGLDLERAFTESTEPAGSVLDSLETREWLFFDETVDVYVVLRAPCATESAFRSYLSRLAISLEAHIVNSHAPGKGSPPASEVIHEGEVAGGKRPFVILDERASTNGGGDESGDPMAYAVWKASVFLARPRIRLQGPSVVFSVSASLRPAENRNMSRPGYLESKVPAGLNLLQAFAGDGDLYGIEPRLSAMRVSRVAPAPQSVHQPRPLRCLHSLSFKIFPVVHTRVRFARPNTVPSSPALVALLEVDFSPFFDCEVVLKDISLRVTDGVVQDLNEPAGIGLPMTCVAHDHVTFLSRLAPDNLDVEASRTAPTTRDLEISIVVTALVKPGVCQPSLTMAWTTALDFTPPLNPGFGTGGLAQPIQRSHRPSQLSIGGDGPGHNDTQSLVAPSISRPDSLPSLESAAARSAADTTIPDFGITMTLTGPKGPVYVGDEFRWTAFVVNRSDAPSASTGAAVSSSPSAARKLALLAIPKRRRNEMRVMHPPSTAGAGPSKRDHLVADAVLDESLVHAVQRSSVVDSADVVSLSADVRVGPLASGACAVVDLRFLALQEGIAGIECIRVVDLGSQEHVDVRELPVVVVRRRP